EKTLTELPDWRIACFYVRRGYRRQGVSRQALEGALEMIAGYSGGVVEGYPEPADAVPAGFLFHGALSTFEQLGFERDRMIGKHGWVVRSYVEGSCLATRGSYNGGGRLFQGEMPLSRTPSRRLVVRSLLAVLAVASA